MRLSESEHVLVLNVHHIVADGWSMGVLTRELGVLYEAFSRGKPSPLPELPIQYADFALWQRQWMQGEVLEAQLAYWKQQLGDSPAILRLPTDRLRPPVLSYHGKHLPLSFSQSLTEQLRTLSQQERVTVFMTLLAAFKALLYCATGQSDIVVGSAFANRNRSELERLIGFFVNTLPLRTDLSGNPSFRELLQRVREVTLGASSHQDLPLATLVRELQPKRDLGRNPLFQVEFALLTPDHNPAVYGYGLRSAVMETLELPELTVTPLDVEGGVARFDMAVFLWNLPTGLSGAWEYNTDLFESATIARLAAHFEVVLHSVAAEPDIPLHRLAERLKETERQQQVNREKAYTESIHQKLKTSRRKAVDR
jgi:non-ribosomal peptide synthetase component F